MFCRVVKTQGTLRTKTETLNTEGVVRDWFLPDTRIGGGRLGRVGCGGVVRLCLLWRRVPARVSGPGCLSSRDPTRRCYTVPGPWGLVSSPWVRGFVCEILFDLLLSVPLWRQSLFCFSFTRFFRSGTTIPQMRIDRSRDLPSVGVPPFGHPWVTGPLVVQS